MSLLEIFEQMIPQAAEFEMEVDLRNLVEELGLPAVNDIFASIAAVDVQGEV